MSAKKEGRPPKVSDEAIINLVQEEERPFSTASDVADQLPIGNDAVRHRLNNLAEDGRINREKVGRSVVWWVPG